jgi:hypothetical protein
LRFGVPINAQKQERQRLFDAAGAIFTNLFPSALTGKSLLHESHGRDARSTVHDARRNHVRRFPVDVSLSALLPKLSQYADDAPVLVMPQPGPALPLPQELGLPAPLDQRPPRGMPRLTSALL